MAVRLLDTLEKLAEWVGRAPHLILAMDLEGTLVPAGARDGAFCISARARQLLGDFAKRPGVSIVIFSSRSRTDLHTRVNIPDLIYAGNHGLEISGRGLLFIEPTAASFCEQLQKFAAGLSSQLQGIAGVVVEDKGLSLQVNGCQVGDTACESVRRIVHNALANTSHPFVLTTADHVYEIRPRVYWDKAKAIGWIREQLGQPDALTMFLSGDDADETFLTAIPEGIVVKVGDASTTKAPYALNGPAEVEALLEWLSYSSRSA